MPASSEIVVVDDGSLLALRAAYLEAVSGGAETFTVVFRKGVRGLDPDVLSGEVTLVPPGAREPPPLDVVLRSDDVTAFARLPLAIMGRSVTLDGLAFVGALSPPLRITASRSVLLRKVTVLGANADERRRAVVDLTAAAPEVELSVSGSTFARSGAPDAVLGCYAGSGGWFSRIAIDDTTVVGGTSDSAIAIDAVASLTARTSGLGAGSARVLLRMDWPAKNGEISGCILSAPEGKLVEIRNAAPIEVDPVRLTGASRVTSSIGFEADSSVVESPAAALDGEFTAAVGRAAEQLKALDGRLEALTG
ncbi:MAG TPA: hypothetical protein VH063_16730 [Gaiellaceae bacterium]|jgi:hypothetical protein|nr:hypothetical protein [Gaiellaceae bacterium]